MLTLAGPRSLSWSMHGIVMVTVVPILLTGWDYTFILHRRRLQQGQQGHRTGPAPTPVTTVTETETQRRARWRHHLLSWSRISVLLRLSNSAYRNIVLLLLLVFCATAPASHRPLCCLCQSVSH
jgi:hypothetical protein